MKIKISFEQLIEILFIGLIIVFVGASLIDYLLKDWGASETLAQGFAQGFCLFGIFIVLYLMKKVLSLAKK